MCRQCQAVEDRHKAAITLFQAVQGSRGAQGYGIGPGLKQVFAPMSLDAEWDETVDRFRDPET